MNVKALATAGEDQGHDAAARPATGSVEPETVEDFPVSALFPADPECATPTFDRSPGGSAGSGRVRLLATVGKAKGKVIEVDRPRFLIGRDPVCDLRAHSLSVSRVHASLERRDGKDLVRDLGSTNGTALNDRVLHGDAAELADGDRLEIGPMRFTVQIRTRPAVERSAARDQRNGPDHDALATQPGLQFTCLIQPGSSVRLFTGPEILTDPTVLGSRARDARSGFEAPTTVERLVEEFRRAIGRAVEAPSALPQAPPARPRAIAAPRATVPAPAEVIGESPLEPADIPMVGFDPEVEAILDGLPELPSLVPLDEDRHPTPVRPVERIGADSEFNSELNEILTEALKDLALGSIAEPAPVVEQADEEEEEKEEEKASVQELGGRLEERTQPRGAKLSGVDFECPRCATFGTVPDGLVGQEFPCRFCKTPIAVGASGVVTVFERPRAAQVQGSPESSTAVRPEGFTRPDAPKTAKRSWIMDVSKRPEPVETAGASKRPGPGVLTGLSGRWGDISRAAKVGLSAAAVLVLVPTHLFVIDPLLHAPPKVRTQQVIEAVLKDREKDLVALADAQTSAQAVAWLKRIGPALRGQVGDGPRPDVRVFWERARDAQTVVNVPLNPAPDDAPKPRAGAARPLRVTKLFLFWKRAPLGDWLLVGNAL